MGRKGRPVMRRKSLRNEPWSPAQASAKMATMVQALERLQDEERSELRLTPDDAELLRLIGVQTTNQE